MNAFHNNGVKRRRDGLGDGWALAHREGLPHWYHMQDIDAFFAMSVVGKNTSERLFCEYAPDSYTNRYSLIRRFAYVALFDRKRSIDVARAEDNVLSTAFYLDVCRHLGADQPRPPRFFWVCGDQFSPWTMHELNIETGTEIGPPHQISCEADWQSVWHAIGLDELRRSLQSFVDPPPWNA